VQRNRAIRRLRRIALDAFWVSAPLFMIAMAFTFLSQPFAVECKAGACVRVCESVHIDLCPTHPQNQYRGPSHNTLSYQLLHHLRSCAHPCLRCVRCACARARGPRQGLSWSCRSLSAGSRCRWWQCSRCSVPTTPRSRCGSSRPKRGSSVASYVALSARSQLSSRRAGHISVRRRVVQDKIDVIK
jgi:hypothetical protein